MARHDKSDIKTINKIERYFICHDTNDIQWYFWPFRKFLWWLHQSCHGGDW